MISEPEIRAINRRLTVKYAALREEAEKLRKERDAACTALEAARRELRELWERHERADTRLASVIGQTWAQAIKDSGGRYREAARRLGIDPSTLWRWRHGRTRWARQRGVA